jgi:uncharacterized iron-regulated protein
MTRPLGFSCLLAFVLAACGPTATTTVTAPAVPPGEMIVDASTGEAMKRTKLMAQLEDADYVLLGEVHDNAEQHRLRAALIALAAAKKKPAIVFEQFPWGPDSALQTKPKGPIEPWLDAAGFDRKGWQWPMHQPIIDTVLKYDLPRYGSQLDRARLKPILQGGPATAPPPLGDLMQQVPLTAEGAAALEQTLAEGHCGELPAGMVPMMRTAQEARDAAMTDALQRARTSGHPAWLIAGNGHVRRDYGVPRFLEKLHPKQRTVSVGFLEIEPDGSLPGVKEREVYDVVWITPRAQREDPCAAMRKQQ